MFRYVHNNIFFSFAVDSDFEQISKDQKLNSQSAVEKHESAVSSDLSAKPLSDVASEKAGNSEGVSDVNPNDAAAEAQITDGEQATYASANNDLKGTKAYQDADVPGLYNLAMAIIDYRGYRVVAQVHL